VVKIKHNVFLQGRHVREASQSRIDLRTGTLEQMGPQCANAGLFRASQNKLRTTSYVDREPIKIDYFMILKYLLQSECSKDGVR
jgi:hypothetical protein